MARVRIHWLRESEGGRANVPRGTKYSAVAQFPENPDDWSKTAWSLVLENLGQPDADRNMLADVRFLSNEGPHARLHPGAVFELYEGERWMARGEVPPG